MNSWFRMYAEFAEDPKVQILAFEDQRHYTMLLCLKCKGTLDTATRNDDHRDALIAKALGLDLIAAKEARRRLVEGMLITSDWQPIAWDKRQFVSDSSSGRVRDFRDRQRAATNRNVTETLQVVTPPVTVTPQTQNRTDTDLDLKSPVDKSAASQRAPVPLNGTGAPKAKTLQGGVVLTPADLKRMRPEIAPGEPRRFPLKGAA